MSISESQYYEAKVFLKALADAHCTLEYIICLFSEASKQQAQVDKLKFYESALVSAANRGHIKISGDSVIRGNGFDGSRVNELSKFVKSYFGMRLKDLDSANTASQLVSTLENGAI